MTKLRDDGYLETDDPVVAACFIEKVVDVCFEKDSDEMSSPEVYWEPLKLYAVAKHCVYISDFDKGSYPILIPAKTVAEVCDAVPGQRRTLIVLSIDNWDVGGKLEVWLQAHK